MFGQCLRGSAREYAANFSLHLSISLSSSPAIHGGNQSRVQAPAEVPPEVGRLDVLSGHVEEGRLERVAVGRHEDAVSRGVHHDGGPAGSHFPQRGHRVDGHLGHLAPRSHDALVQGSVRLQARVLRGGYRGRVEWRSVIVASMRSGRNPLGWQTSHHFPNFAASTGDQFFRTHVLNSNPIYEL